MDTALEICMGLIGAQNMWMYMYMTMQTLDSHSLGMEWGCKTHLTLLLRWSVAGSSRARPVGRGGPVGSGCCWKMSSGVRSTSVGLTMTFAAESNAVFPLL